MYQSGTSGPFYLLSLGEGINVHNSPNPPHELQTIQLPQNWRHQNNSGLATLICSFIDASGMDDCKWLDDKWMIRCAMNGNQLHLSAKINISIAN